MLEKYKECFHELELLGTKAKQASNYNIFITLFIKHDKEVLEKLKREKVDPCYKGFLENGVKSIL